MKTPDIDTLMQLIGLLESAELKSNLASVKLALDDGEFEVWAAKNASMLYKLVIRTGDLATAIACFKSEVEK